MKKLLIGIVVAAAAVSTTPLARAEGDPSNLDIVVRQVYNLKQSLCTPGYLPMFLRVVWDGGGPTGTGGTGRIEDRNPALGGPVTAAWDPGPNAPPGAKSMPALGGGYWDITLLPCH